MPHLDETGENDKLKAMKYTESASKKGNGKSEDADIEMKQLFNRAEPRRCLTANRKFLKKFESFRTSSME